MGRANRGSLERSAQPRHLAAFLLPAPESRADHTGSIYAKKPIQRVIRGVGGINNRPQSGYLVMGSCLVSDSVSLLHCKPLGSGELLCFFSFFLLQSQWLRVRSERWAREGSNLQTTIILLRSGQFVCRGCQDCQAGMDFEWTSNKHFLEKKKKEICTVGSLCSKPDKCLDWGLNRSRSLRDQEE